MGYDVHKLVEGRKLIMGGVDIPYEKGLLGHSDADVLLHAVMDALLGAAALGDIGKHFPDTDEAFNQMDDICYEWEKRCNMELEFDEISSIWEKDVNNYVFIFSNGKVERKGAYVKELSPLDYDLPIINKALVDRLVKGIPIEATINGCQDLKEFQMVKKISSKYDCIMHGGHWEKHKAINPATGRLKTFTRFVGNTKKLNEKCVRVFASVNESDGGLWKIKKDGSKAKVEGTPEHCFIFNDEVNGVKVPRQLNKQWYIDTAYDRLSGFGICEGRR